MNNKEIAEYLRKYNVWRRYNGDIQGSPRHPNPKQLGVVIDAAIDALKEAKQ